MVRYGVYLKWLPCESMSLKLLHSRMQVVLAICEKFFDMKEQFLTRIFWGEEHSY